MFKIAQKLGLSMIDTVRLIEADQKIKAKGVMNIESFRELLLFMPGLTTQLRSVTGLAPYEMCKVKANLETYAEMISEYKERIGIEWMPSIKK